MVKRIASVLALSLMCLSACSSTQRPLSLYDEIGGAATVDQVVENFIREIEYDPIIIEYFLETDIDRFREKLTEHICVNTGGPCDYTGDTMEQVHSGMNISERDFNRTVDLLINAMTDAGISHPNQNRILAVFAPMRGDMIYK